MNLRELLEQLEDLEEEINCHGGVAAHHEVHFQNPHADGLREVNHVGMDKENNYIILS